MTTPPWGEQPQEQPPTNPYQPPQPPASPYQPYAAPGSPYGGYPAPQQTNGLAIASLAVSIAGLPLCCGMSGIVGAILGHVGRKQIKESQNQTGEGLALAGIIIGWVSFGLFLAGVIAYIALIAFAVSTEPDDDYCYTDSTGEEVCY